MKLLALDTSSVACSVALLSGDDVVERHEEQPREHTRILLPMIRELLDASATELGELDAIVLGNGPGSFIGMRIAASVAQGLAFGARLPVAPVSSLAAVAAQVFDTSDAAQAVVTQDAHMNEVYLGVFDRDPSGLPRPMAGECLHGQGVIDGIGESAATTAVAAGSGWLKYPALWEANRSRLAGRSPLLYPRARYLLSLGAKALQSKQTIDPKDINPAYLRQKVASKPAARP